MKRNPVVAGRFYPSDKSALERNLSSLCDKGQQKQKVLGCIMPHAGYQYSGKTAGRVVSKIEVKDRVIIIGPNHTGQGLPFSIYPQGQWSTPLGTVDVDEELADLLLSGCELLEEDYSAHLFEHSLEVEIPFLQYFNEKVKIVPICVGGGNLSQWKKLGQDMARVVEEKRLDVLMVASSDMNHFESLEVSKKKDKMALDEIIKLDEKALVEAVAKHDISMCGYMPVSILISYAKARSAKVAEVVDYTTSEEASGDTSSVVGYAGVIVY